MCEQAGFEIGVAGVTQGTAGDRAGGDQRDDLDIGRSTNGERAGDFGLRIGQREEGVAFEQIAVLEVGELGPPGDEGVALLRDLADGDAWSCGHALVSMGW